MIINNEDYDIDELASEYGSMRKFVMDLNCNGTMIFNNDPSLYQIDYFDGLKFQEIYTIDLPFTEYEDHGICSADIRKIGGEYSGMAEPGIPVNRATSIPVARAMDSIIESHMKRVASPHGRTTTLSFYFNLEYSSLSDLPFNSIL